MSEGKKYDTGKLRYDLLPPEALKEVVKVITFGAAKYGDNNWQGVEEHRYIAALYRHIERYRMGELKDSESGIHHMAHAACNVLFILFKSLKGSELDEFYKELEKEYRNDI